MKPIGLAILAHTKEHAAPSGHPERPDKLQLILPELDKQEYRDISQEIPMHSYEQSCLTRVHDARYIERLAQFSDSAVGYLDPDTYITATSFEASCRVTWSLLGAVDLAFGDGPRASFILGRPPGHHAETDRGMGFCLVNHIAVAAQYALDRRSAKQVAIVDFDIHHGNGSQHIFYERDDVLYISVTDLNSLGMTNLDGGLGGRIDQG